MPEPSKRAKGGGAGTRTRGEERREDIRRVVLELVAAHGIEGVSMDSIATAAQASKQTLYNRWPTKQELIRDAIRLSFVGGQPTDPGDLGSLREELRVLLEAAAEMLPTNKRLIIALIDGAQRDPVIMAVMRQETRDNFRELLQRPFKRAIARGEISPETDISLVPDVALPLLLGRAMWDEIVDARFVAWMIDSVLLRIVRWPGED